LDGSKPEINDRIRGRGSYEKTLRAAKLLLEQDLDVRLYPTITKLNIDDLPDMKKLILKLRPGFDHLSCAKFVALGRGSEHEQELELSPKEFYEAFIRMPIGTYSTPEIIKKLKVAQETYDLTSFVPNRIPYGCLKVNCGLGSGTFSIDRDGRVYPCQWLHLPEYQAGNLHDRTLEEIYYGSDMFLKMRALRVDADIPTCGSCEFK
jgi:radical SAM protein with 4Fe4S-binding SPASM domain